MKKTIRSFPPIIDQQSRILILGTMPGPVALARQEYYGFGGNHFWKIMFHLFEIKKPLTYPEKKKLLADKRIALWDVFKSCEREGALDSKIKHETYNDISGLLKKYPNIHAVFLNSKTAEKIFQNKFSSQVKIPPYYLPSTSPANASINFEKKLKAWSVILKYLGEPGNPQVN